MTHVVYKFYRRKHLEGLKLVDMHLHTDASDGDPLDKILKKARKKRIELAITDHNEIKSSLLAHKKYKNIIPAIEATTKEGFDLLFYFTNFSDLIEFYNIDIKDKGLTDYGIYLHKRLKWQVEDLIEKGKKYNAFISLAHPTHPPYIDCHNYFLKNEHLIKKLDAIEGVNGALAPKYNKIAIDFAKKYNKPMTGGSDAHRHKFIGRIVTAAFAENIDSFFDELRKGNNSIYGRPLTLFERMSSHIILIKRNIKWLKNI